MREAQWLSATSAGRLLRCPASAAFTVAPVVPTLAAPRNAGSLAHLAMSAWLKTGAWGVNSPGTSLQASWDAEAARWSVGAKQLRDSVLTRSRLRRRGAELARLLKASGSRVFSETVLTDGPRRLYGQLDVVVSGAGDGAVIDLKTGDSGTSAISDDVRTQLLIYAHLFREKHGHLPGKLLAFSLRYGALQTEFSQSDIDALLTRIENARDTQPRLAVPDPTGCRFCRRRLGCEPHWEAADMWEDPDCMEGRIVKVERSRAGLTAVRVATSRGEEWVSGLIGVGDGIIGPGSAFRVTEIAGRSVGDQLDWRASGATRMRSVPG